jgi:spermidine synthase
MHRRRWVVFLLFFASGASGLIYEVVWVRQFGILFGSTVYSAALVTGIYMCGLGLGGYLVGAWADRRFRIDPVSPLRWYGVFELGIGALVAATMLAIPALAGLAALASTYVEGANGWYQLAPFGSALRYACAAALLGPVTILMGGTLTLLIRFLVQEDLASAGWQIGALYGVNTAGAALGCLLTDTALVPLLGLRATQLLAISLNGVAATGALLLARSATRRQIPSAPADVAPRPALEATVWWAGATVALTGFAAMAMQIVWFRHLISIYGASRAVFSILLTVILVGIWIGSWAGGYLARRTQRPAHLFAVAQAGFVAWTLGALLLLRPGALDAHVQALGTSEADAWLRWASLYSFLLKETSWVVGIPALFSGAAFPLANAIVQRAREKVGERAGFLYLANTLGGVLGSVLAGFALLPRLGIQDTAALVGGCILLSMVTLRLAAGAELRAARARLLYAGCLAAALATLAAWSRMPDEALLRQTLPTHLDGPESRILAVKEGVNETIAVSERPGFWIRLVTNGHSMSDTSLVAQRYMRAFVHVPMLVADDVDRVMVMCFGIGNTASAALLHEQIRRVDVVDISRDVLEHSRFFAPATGDPLADPRVQVYVNDARHHLRMLDGESYDLITGEPPPIGHAGVVNLYTREFFELARSRLRPGGIVTYWLPLNEVGASVARSMVRAFLDVFPTTVLLSGHRQQLILMGRKGGALHIDPERVRKQLDDSPAFRRDLHWLPLAAPVELVGMLAATAETLDRATQGVEPLRDDRPILEYGSRALRSDPWIPPDLVSVADVERWCPRCAEGALRPEEEVELAGYLAVIARYYQSQSFLSHFVGEQRRPFRMELSESAARAVANSLYLQEILQRRPRPYRLALLQVRHGQPGAAVASLRRLVREQPRHLRTYLDLAELYLELSRPVEARRHLELVLGRDPDNARARRYWERLPAEAPTGAG